MTEIRRAASTDLKARPKIIATRLNVGPSIVVDRTVSGAVSPQKSAPLAPCDQHPSENLNLYCLECEEAFCIMCYTTQHNEHKSTEIVKVVGEFKKEIEGIITELENSIQATEQKLEKNQDKRRNVVRQFDRIEAEVNAQTDEQKAVIEDRRLQLMAELNVKRMKQVEETDKSISDVTKSKEEMDKLLNESMELLKNGSNVDIARKFRDLKVRSTEVKGMCDNVQTTKLPNVVVTFTPSETLPTNVVGTLKSTSYTGHSVGNMFGPALKLSLNSDNSVNALCSCNGQLFVTHYRTKQIAVYDTTLLTLSRIIPIPDAGNRLSGLAASSNSNCLYVSDWDKDHVYVVGLSDTDIIPSVKTWSVDNGPRGLSVNKKHNLLVAYGIAKKVQEYTPDGKLVRSIIIGNCLWHAVELNSGATVMSQYGPFYGVSLMSADGKILKHYDSSKNETAAGKKNPPRSLAVDSRGYIMMADRCNNRILVLNPKMTEFRRLPLQTPLESPTSLDYDESRGRLYVGEFTGQYRVLVFDNIFSLSSLF